MDIAARTIGGLCARTLAFGDGMPLEELVLRHAVGVDIPSTTLAWPASGVMMIPIPTAGTLTAVRGVDAAKAVDGVSDLVMTMREGQRLVPLPEGGDYLGFIFARGETPDAVEASLRAAHAALEFDIEAEAQG